jgi:hypothetical protein
MIMGISFKSITVFRSRLAVAAILFSLSTWSNAVVLDLSTTAISYGTINGAQFYNSSVVGFGSGTAVDFLTFGGSGYNTDGAIEFETGNRHDAINRSTLGLVEIGGTFYREFAFDMNEPGKGNDDSLLSLDTVEIYISNVGNLTGYNFGSAATLIYDMDFGEDSWIKLDAALQGGPGSGSSDLLMYVPDALFDGSIYGDDPFVYLYSETGGQGGALANHAGDEAWVYLSSEVAPVPLPAAAWLFLSGFLGLIGYSTRRSRRV